MFVCHEGSALWAVFQSHINSDKGNFLRQLGEVKLSLASSPFLASLVTAKKKPTKPDPSKSSDGGAWASTVHIPQFLSPTCQANHGAAQPLQRQASGCQPSTLDARLHPGHDALGVLLYKKIERLELANWCNFSTHTPHWDVSMRCVIRKLQLWCSLYFLAGVSWNSYFFFFFPSLFFFDFLELSVY